MGIVARLDTRETWTPAEFKIEIADYLRSVSAPVDFDEPLDASVDGVAVEARLIPAQDSEVVQDE